jgi:hypothetical protein
VYPFSKNENQRIQKLSVDELAVDLKKLVQHAFTTEPQRNDEDEQRWELLVGKTVNYDQQGKAAFKERNPHTTQQQEPVVRSPDGPQTKTGQGTRQSSDRLTQVY